MRCCKFLEDHTMLEKMRLRFYIVFLSIVLATALFALGGTKSVKVISDLNGSDLRSSIYENVNFANANLSRTDMRLCQFRNCRFHGAILSGAKLARGGSGPDTLSKQQIASIDWQDEEGEEPPGG